MKGPPPLETGTKRGRAPQDPADGEEGTGDAQFVSLLVDEAELGSKDARAEARQQQEAFDRLLEEMESRAERERRTRRSMPLFDEPADVRSRVWARVLLEQGLLSTSWLLRGTRRSVPGGLQRGIPDMAGIGIQNMSSVLEQYASSLCKNGNERLTAFVDMLRRVNPFCLLPEEMVDGSPWHIAVLKTVIASIHWFEMEHIRRQVGLDAASMRFLMTNNYMHFMRRHLPSRRVVLFPGIDAPHDDPQIVAWEAYREQTRQDTALVRQLYDETRDVPQGPWLYDQATGHRMYWLEVRFSNFVAPAINYQITRAVFFPTLMEILPAEELTRRVYDDPRIIRYNIAPALYEDGTPQRRYSLAGGAGIARFTPAIQVADGVGSFSWVVDFMPSMGADSTLEQRTKRQMYRRFCGTPSDSSIPEMGAYSVNWAHLAAHNGPDLSLARGASDFPLVSVLVSSEPGVAESVFNAYGKVPVDSELGPEMPGRYQHRIPMWGAISGPDRITPGGAIKKSVFFNVLWRHEKDWVPLVPGLTTITQTPGTPFWRSNAAEVARLVPLEKWRVMAERLSIPWAVRKGLARLLVGALNDASEKAEDTGGASCAKFAAMLLAIQQRLLGSPGTGIATAGSSSFASRYRKLFEEDIPKRLIQIETGTAFKERWPYLSRDWREKFMQYVEDLLQMYQFRAQALGPAGQPRHLPGALKSLATDQVLIMRRCFTCKKALPTHTCQRCNKNVCSECR